MKRSIISVLSLAVLLGPHGAFGATGGSLSGTVTDPSGAVVPGSTVILLDAVHHRSLKVNSDAHGIYTFLNLPLGYYEMTATAAGFSTRRIENLFIDATSSVHVDVRLTLATQKQTITVRSATQVHVETASNELGETVSTIDMTSLPLDGRSYTDLLSVEPGVAPMSTLLPNSVVMAGVTGNIDPSGDENPGNVAIDGQRESSNGFLVNGIDVQEHMNGGTSIIPDLDSIEEFRVLTSNFDPEYGNYNGGIVTVLSKAGTNDLHGSAFDFFRNTALDARGYFDPQRATFNQNQFGGTLGGPWRADKLFFFSDYQGTRTAQGVSTGVISVPTLAQRNGVFTDLTGNVGGPYFANLLSNRLGYKVDAGEPYSQVFPGGVIPHAAWSGPAAQLLPYIPTPNVGPSTFSTSSFSQTVRDDKGSFRVDANTSAGQLSVYYFIDDYRLDNPYPTSVAGATIPGFDALYLGRAQLLSVGHTAILNARTAHEFHFGYLRNNNVVGQPKGGLGVTLASQGFATSDGSGPGIYVQAPQFEGIENITFPTFAMGVPITNLTQANNAWFLSDGLAHAIGSHTLKLGGQFHADQVNILPNATFNGTFNINGTETGEPIADFLLGIGSNFTQSSGQHTYLRNWYLGLYAQDSWRASRRLTVNAGIRWEHILPWWEKYDQLQTYVPGSQSVIFPGAPRGLLVAGDPGVPRTIAPADNGTFAPRFGLVSTTGSSDGWRRVIFGKPDESSIRVGFGVFYTAFQGLSAGIMYAVPPFGYNYLSPGPPLLDEPFITAATGVDNGQRFPISFPPHSSSRQQPDTSVQWNDLLPISADPFFSIHNRPAYVGSYSFSFERQLSARALLSLTYTGNQAHRLLALVSVNPGDPQLCMQHMPACGPFGEDSTYPTSTGQLIQGTRVGQGSDYGENTADTSVANSNYNALQVKVHYERGLSHILLGYTYGKSIDQGSNLGEQLDPFDPRHSRTISAWDIRHNMTASYTVAVPLRRLFGRANIGTNGWSVSGVTRFTTGFPVTMFDNSDNSLLGTLGNGANNFLLDTPRELQGPLQINHNGRNGRPAFNTNLFPEELVGQLGNSRRRAIYGPGVDNTDVAIRKTIELPDRQSIELRAEAFNAFNHAQFYGPSSVDGQREDPNFGSIQSAAPGRLIQLAAKFAF